MSLRSTISWVSMSGPASADASSDSSQRYSIRFGEGSITLDQDANETLDRAAIFLKYDPYQQAIVVGFGTPIDQLGEQRAETVRSYLVSLHRIDPKRIQLGNSEIGQTPQALLTVSAS